MSNCGFAQFGDPEIHRTSSQDLQSSWMSGKISEKTIHWLSKSREWRHEIPTETSEKSSFFVFFEWKNPHEIIQWSNHDFIHDYPIFIDGLFMDNHGYPIHNPLWLAQDMGWTLSNPRAMEVSIQKWEQNRHQFDPCSAGVGREDRAKPCTDETGKKTRCVHSYV